MIFAVFIGMISHGTKVRWGSVESMVLLTRSNVSSEGDVEADVRQTCYRCMFEAKEKSRVEFEDKLP